MGRQMLISAIMRAISISEHAGVVGFFVDVKNNQKTGLIRRGGQKNEGSQDIFCVSQFS
ncbi:hypothetical protein D1AOALGA4SA_11281 [Olavius algarvensis Delta 1 endosymbiont]|nr:hypothetical protein D1AOALGA4SA_11281 [Olavius algarvensis Delta 1 endosymbiont]